MVRSLNNLEISEMFGFLIFSSIFNLGVMCCLYGDLLDGLLGDLWDGCIFFYSCMLPGLDTTIRPLLLLFQLKQKKCSCSHMCSFDTAVMEDVLVLWRHKSWFEGYSNNRLDWSNLVSIQFSKHSFAYNYYPANQWIQRNSEEKKSPLFMEI